MAVNEMGENVPPEVVEAARLRRCRQGVKYVYRDGHYGAKGPASSIGGSRAFRFTSGGDDRYKREIYPGWVAFVSPTNTTGKLGK
jgi:hypothetical protein